MVRVAALAAALTLAAPLTAQARTQVVDSGKQFSRALLQAQPGDIIQLEATSFPALTVQNESYGASPVQIVGMPGTTVAGMTIENVTGLSISSLEIKPNVRDTSGVSVNIATSDSISVSNVTFNGVDLNHGARLNIGNDVTNVTVTNSSFTECGVGKWCLQPSGTHILIQGNTFTNCESCDPIHGGGSDITINGNSLDGAVIGHCGRLHCHHNDLLQIMGGGPWTITNNRFGRHQFGGGCIWIKPGIHNRTRPVHDVLIASNDFWAQDAPFLYAVRVADHPGPTGMPVNVTIVNNTILSGTTSGIRLGDPYAQMPPAQRPLVANNILGRFGAANCADGRYEHNLMEHGGTCDISDESGNANLNAQDAPTALSLLVIDMADPAVAPTLDMFGHARVGPPDLGAIEFIPPG
jgi:hypothetical protein